MEFVPLLEAHCLEFAATYVPNDSQWSLTGWSVMCREVPSSAHPSPLFRLVKSTLNEVLLPQHTYPTFAITIVDYKITKKATTTGVWLPSP